MANSHAETGEWTSEHRDALFLGPHAHRAFLTACEPPETHHEADPMRFSAPNSVASPDQYYAALFLGPHALERYELRPAVDVGTTQFYAFIQAIKPVNLIEDMVVSSSGRTFQVHLQVTAGQVLMLPLEVCQWLQANQLGAWGQMTVIPNQFSTVVDGGTGLDTAHVVSTATWGITTSGIPYFTPDGDMGSGERADLFVAAGVPFLQQ